MIGSGGGIAELSAAYRLRQPGHELRAIEASDDVCGIAATYETAGDPVENTAAPANWCLTPSAQPGRAIGPPPCHVL